jgi:hypothetical protein
MKIDFNNFIRGFLVIFACLAFAGIIILVLLVGIKNLDPLVAGLIGTAFGALSSQYNKVYEYFFGSSQGSKEKQDTINTLTQEIKRQ